MTDLYYIMDAAGRRGPFTLDALRTQPLAPDTLVCRNGQEPWVPAGQIPGLLPSHTPASYAVPQARPPSLARTGYVCNAIIAINVIVFVIMGLSGVSWFQPDGAALLPWGADLWPLTTSGQLWRLVTAAFLHFGLIHLLANMYALASVGWLTERLFGSVFFAVLYLLSAVASSAVSIWWDRDAVCAGASGAVFAVYGALFGYLMVHRSAFPRQAVQALLSSTMVFVGYNVLYGLSRPGISNSAHLSGLACGVLLGALFARPLEPARRAAQTRRRAALALVAALAIAGGVVFGLPKGDYDPKAEQEFDAIRNTIGAQETKAVDAFNALVQQSKQEKLDDQGFAAGLDKDVIPVWQSMAARLENLALKETSTARPLRDALLAYCQEHAKLYQTYSTALKSGATQDATKFSAQEKRANDARAHLKEVLGTKH